MSQHGEDGIIGEVLRRVSTSNQFFAEIGVEDGVECNAAYLARCCGWSGLMIEGNAVNAKRLERYYRSFKNVRVAHRFVTRETVAGVFREHSVPTEFDLLSIDVDGNDYWIWDALRSFHPRLVVIEYNAAYPPPVRLVMEYSPEHVWNKTSYYGASLAALASLGVELGYALLGTESNGANAFFLRRDLLHKSAFNELSPESAYHPARYGLIGQQHAWGFGPYRAV